MALEPGGLNCTGVGHSVGQLFSHYNHWDFLSYAVALFYGSNAYRRWHCYHKRVLLLVEGDNQ